MTVDHAHVSRNRAHVSEMGGHVCEIGAGVSENRSSVTVDLGYEFVARSSVCGVAGGVHGKGGGLIEVPGGARAEEGHCLHGPGIRVGAGVLIDRLFLAWMRRATT